MTITDQDRAAYAKECGRCAYNSKVAKNGETARKFSEVFFKTEIEQTAYVVGWNLAMLGA